MEKKILLIDDDKEELELFTDALNKVPAAFICEQVSGWGEVVSMLNKYTPDFIFIDYKMPLLDGIEYLIKLRSIKELKDTRFIMYSNCMDEDLSLAAKEAGVVCIKKPYRTSLLVRYLKEILLDYHSA